MNYCPIAKAAALYPDLPALITDKHTLSYSALNTFVEHLCMALKDLGVDEGQRIAFVASKRWEEVPLFFALWRLKATICPLSFRLPKEALKSALATLQPHLALQEIPDTAARPFKENQLCDHSLATLLFTSGTTSQPKIAAHSIDNLFSSAEATNERIALNPGDRFLLSLPLFHVGGIGAMIRCMKAGATLIVSQKPLSSALQEYQINYTSLVPTQLVDCKELPTSLKGILLGGAPLPPALFIQNLPLFSTYGMSEMSSQIATDKSPSIEGTHVTCGRPIPHAQVKIAPDGEILARGPMLFQGYWKNNEDISLPLQEGWFATRDLGKWSADGRLILLGRKDNLFISGGENIQPEEIEAALLTLGSILEAVVVPLHDPLFGARPVAWIRPVGVMPKIEEISEQLTDLLPKYKHPVRLVPLPETEFKISRHHLRELTIKIFATKAIGIR